MRAAHLGATALIVCLCTSAGSGRQLEPSTLQRGVSIEREIGHDGNLQAAHEYRLNVEHGQYLRIDLEQRGGDISAILFAPDGTRVGDAISAASRRGGDTLSDVADQSGAYRIVVQRPGTWARAGRYTLTLAELRPSVPADRTRVAAERAYAEASRLRSTGNASSIEASVAKYQEAIRHARAVAHSVLECDAQHNLGLAYDYLGQYARALEAYDASLALARALGDRRREAVTISNAGFIHRVTGNVRAAVQAYEQSLALAREAGNATAEGTALHNLGTAHWTTGDYDRALDFYTLALDVRRRIGDRAAEGETLLAIGGTHRARSHVQVALDFYRRALALKREAGDRRGQARVLHNLAVAYSILGEFARAQEYEAQSLAISRPMGDKEWESAALLGIGTTHRLQGELDKAVDLYAQALALRQSLGDVAGQGDALSSLGLTHELRGQPKVALPYYESALALARKAGNRRGEAFALQNVGVSRLSLGDADGAREALEASVSLSRAMGDRDGLSAALADLARVALARSELARARELAEEASRVVDSVRAGLTVPTLRASYAGLADDVREVSVDVLMQSHRHEPEAGFAVAALAANERARARSLRELLLEADADVRRHVDPALLRRERQSRERINAAERSRLDAAATGQAVRATTAAREVEQLLSEYEQIDSEIRAAQPAATDHLPPIAELQRALDRDTVLVEYSLGRTRSYVWIVAHDSVTSVELPARAAIEAAARDAYELMVASQRTDARARARRAAADLSRAIVAPIVDRLRGKRIVIVADGALEYVPFAALPEPDAKATVTPSHPPLIVDHEVVMLPSASVLTLLRESRAGRRPPAKSVAVFADPVLTADDPRVGVATRVTVRHDDEAAASDAPVSDVLRSAKDTGRSSFERLPYSALEADAIASLATEGDALKATGFRASRARVLSADLGDYHIIHFATHGLVNSQHPELSGVVLSLVDDRGQPQDGFLRLHDIYDLDLKADLVVLSACSTALGKAIKGDGLVGLTRGFMHAGTPRVVASLWEVRDRATAELMTRFYRGVLRDGLTPAAALRRAQISMWKDPRWSAPFYWAAFVLQGEWR